MNFIKKIIFFLPSLEKGGAEKNMYTLYKNIVGFDKKLVVFNTLPKDDEPKLIIYGKNKFRDNLLSIIKTIKSEKPDIIMSSHFHISIFLILIKKILRLKTKIVIRQSFTLSNLASSNKIYKKLARLFKYADLLIFQTNHMKDDFGKFISLSLLNSHVIYNPIIEPSEIDLNKKKGKYFLAVGSLKPVKNFSYLISKYSDAYRVNKEILPLYIIGEGPERVNLEEQIKNLNLTEHVFLLGEINDITHYYLNAKVVLICSLSEGLPNVLLEALSFKANVLVRKHLGGTKEVLQRVDLIENYVDEIDFNQMTYKNTSEENHYLLFNEFGYKVILARYEKLLNELF